MTQSDVEAAENGSSEAQSNLGHLYQKGVGVVQSDVEALRWFRMAADQGYAEAQSSLGFHYE